jgi:hypothetical protein
MQRIGAIVGDQMVGLAIQRELRTANAVGVAAGDRAEMAGQRLVFSQGIEPEHDIVEPAGAVGYVDLGNHAAQAQEAHAQAVVVGHREDLDRLPALRRAVRRAVEPGGGTGRCARDRGRECCSDCAGAPLARGGLALQAEAYAAGQAGHDIPFPFTRSPIGLATN